MNRPALLLLLLSLTTMIILLVTPFLGDRIIPWQTIWQLKEQSVDASILLQLRIPRVATAFLTGSMLALCGMVFQTMFRNPLATPFTLGVSSGAALGAALYLRIGITFTLLGIPASSLAAFLGSLLAISLVYALTRIKSDFSTATMLLAGVAISFTFSSLIMFIQYISDFNNSFRILRWLMGGVEVVGFSAVWNLLPFFLIGTILILGLTREMNLLISGDELSASRGLDPLAIKKILFILCSLMVGATVSLCGPIGFVGMMAPHICRLLVGWNHLYLTPAVILFGGSFLTICDLLARSLTAPAEIPVGIITSLLGGPFFLWLLMRKRRL